MKQRIAMSKKNEMGFSIVEIIISILIIAVFSGAIFQLTIVQTQVSGGWLQFEKAEQLAYNNLGKYARYVAAQTNTCTSYPTATTEVQLLSETVTVSGLPNPVVQSVITSMPYGCSSTSLTNGAPIKVVSTVTYGPNSKTSTYATYVNAGG